MKNLTLLSIAIFTLTFKLRVEASPLEFRVLNEFSNQNSLFDNHSSTINSNKTLIGIQGHPGSHSFLFLVGEEVWKRHTPNVAIKMGYSYRINPTFGMKLNLDIGNELYFYQKNGIKSNTVDSNRFNIQGQFFAHSSKFYRLSLLSGLIYQNTNEMQISGLPGIENVGYRSGFGYNLQVLQEVKLSPKYRLEALVGLQEIDRGTNSINFQKNIQIQIGTGLVYLIE